ncbi:MAG TPA: hypothetical protein PLJ78_15355 [Anaerolineae bacterium]|nr:hypothetical protein [Anaerolineae bacterium]HQK15310.1 hypothetical protein [Anaerolineae bacterium]
MENPQLDTAIMNIRLGARDAARRSLLQLVRQDPNDELAWLWLAQTLDDPKRQMDCLRQVLRINPNNPDALTGIEALRAGWPLPEPQSGGPVLVEEPEASDLFPQEMISGWGAMFEEPAAPPPKTSPFLDELTPLPTMSPLREGTPPVEELLSPTPFARAEETSPVAPVAPLEELLTPMTGARAAKTPPSTGELASPSAVTDVEEMPPVEAMPATQTGAAAESFLQRARRTRFQGLTPSAAPVAPEVTTTSQPPSAPPSAEAVSEATVEPRAPASVRKFRLFDGRVFFSILGLLELPLLIALAVLLLRGEGSSLPFLGALKAPQAEHPALRACRNLSLAEFTRVETLGGTLTADTIFTGTQVVITKTIVVPEEYRLLIYPGATLVFSTGTTIEVYGTLYACGNEVAPVVFTAWDQQPGGWEGIRLYNPNTASILSHTRIEYAGERALYLFNNAPILSNVTVADSALFALSFDGSIPLDLSQNVNFADNPVNGIEVRAGTLRTPNIVWPASNIAYVVTGPLWVDEEVTLDIKTGAIVKFWARSKGQPPGIWVRGLLKANGVHFTSIHDSRPEVGGVTYREAIDPQPGDWGSITFYESSQKSYLRDVTIRYGGRATAAVLIRGSSPELTQVTIADSAGYPLGADANASPVFNTLTLTGNRGADALEITGMTLTGEGEWTWNKLGGDTPIVRVVRDTVTVGPQAKLTIQPGVVVKFTETGKLVVRGVLSAIGGNGPADKIVFTSVHDDEYGGDTDGITTPQDRRAWGGIMLEGVDGTTDIQNVLVRHAPITLVDAAPRLYNVQLYATSGAGLRMTPGSSPNLRVLQFEGSGLKGIAVLTGTIETDQTWARLGGPTDQVVRVLEGEVIVKPGAVLSIDVGTVIKAAPAGKLTVLGHLRATGRSDQMVVFTSLNDDLMGNTNNRMLNPGPTDWPGIDIGPEANALMENVGIYYAQVGLTLRGKAMPETGKGPIHIAHSHQPLACTTKMQIPSVFLLEDNEVAVTRCPTP